MSNGVGLTHSEKIRLTKEANKVKRESIVEMVDVSFRKYEEGIIDLGTFQAIIAHIAAQHGKFFFNRNSYTRELMHHFGKKMFEIEKLMEVVA